MFCRNLHSSMLVIKGLPRSSNKDVLADISPCSSNNKSNTSSYLSRLFPHKSTFWKRDVSPASFQKIISEFLFHIHAHTDGDTQEMLCTITVTLVQVFQLLLSYCDTIFTLFFIIIIIKFIS
jgi:hypothetical protein